MAERKFHEYLDMLIDMSGVKNVEIAQRVGLNNANYVSMIRHGKARLPIVHIKKFAEAVGVDPAHLFRQALAEYNPELLALVDDITKNSVLSKGELEVLDAIRSAVGDKDVSVRTSKQRKQIEEMSRQVFV